MVWIQVTNALITKEDPFLKCSQDSHIHIAEFSFPLMSLEIINKHFSRKAFANFFFIQLHQSFFQLGGISEILFY